MEYKNRSCLSFSRCRYKNKKTSRKTKKNPRWQPSCVLRPRAIALLRLAVYVVFGINCFVYSWIPSRSLSSYLYRVEASAKSRPAPPKEPRLVTIRDHDRSLVGRTGLLRSEVFQDDAGADRE
jgi:hypothetical protein